MFKRLALIALAVSAIALMSCSSSGGDEREAVNPLSADEQKAQAAVLEVNAAVLEEINDTMSSYNVTPSARAAVTTPINETVDDDEYEGTATLTGEMVTDEATGKVSFDGTYVFTNYNYVERDPKTGAETLYVINGTETVTLDATTTSTGTSTTMSIATNVAERDTGDLDVSVAGTIVPLIFDYTVNYTYNINYVMTDSTYTIEYAIKGAVDGTYNDQYVYQPFEDSQVIDMSDLYTNKR